MTLRRRIIGWFSTARWVPTSTDRVVVGGQATMTSIAHFNSADAVKVAGTATLALWKASDPIRTGSGTVRWGSSLLGEQMMGMMLLGYSPNTIPLLSSDSAIVGGQSQISVAVVMASSDSAVAGGSAALSVPIPLSSSDAATVGGSGGTLGITVTLSSSDAVVVGGQSAWQVTPSFASVDHVVVNGQATIAVPVNLASIDNVIVGGSAFGVLSGAGYASGTLQVYSAEGALV